MTSVFSETIRRVFLWQTENVEFRAKLTLGSILQGNIYKIV